MERISRGHFGGESVGYIATGNRSIIRGVVIFFTEVTVEIVDHLPVFKELPLDNLVDFKWNSDSLLMEGSLDLFEVVCIIVLVLGVEKDLLLGRVGVELIQDTAVYNPIAQIFDFHVQREVRKEAPQPIDDDCLGRDD